MGEDIKTTDGLLIFIIGLVYWFGSLYIGTKIFDCYWNWKQRRKLQLDRLPSVEVTHVTEI